MFKVTLNRENSKKNPYDNEQSYYVYDTNELIEVKKLSDYSFFGINKESVHVDIVNDGDNLAAVITHTTPTIIDAYMVDWANTADRNIAIDKLNNPELIHIKFLPYAEITEEEYNLLFDIARDQGYFNRSESLETDLQTARQYVHQNK